jgi:hypothetical protein
MTLIDWLREQLDADERLAQATTPGPWRYDPTKVNEISREESVFAGPDGRAATTIASTGPCDDPPSMSDARFIAAWDPARVLAEVKAKRAILNEAIHLESEEIIQLLRQPYAGREGWKDEWAVTD